MSIICVISGALRLNALSMSWRPNLSGFPRLTASGPVLPEPPRPSRHGSLSSRSTVLPKHRHDVEVRSMRKLLAAFGAVLDLVERVRSALREPVFDWRADRRRADARRALTVVLAHDTAEIEAWFRLAAGDLNLAIASIRARSIRARGD